MQITCVGTGDDGTTPCALVEASSGRRLLLNASEGLQACHSPTVNLPLTPRPTAPPDSQRLSAERRLKLHRDLDAVLLSSLDAAAVAGLPGLLLSLAHAGVRCASAQPCEHARGRGQPKRASHAGGSSSLVRTASRPMWPH